MDTLKDLAEHCYQRWLTKDQTDLPSGAIKWMRDSLAESVLAGQIEEIFSAVIKPSEKCYRFLKMTGVIERERLVQLLRKQVLDELDNEREQRLLEVDESLRASIAARRQKIFNKPDDNALPFFAFGIIVGIVFGIAGVIVGGVSDGLSMDIGWRAGLLIGAVAAYGYRRSRSNTLTQQFVSSAGDGVKAQTKGIEEDIRDRVSYIARVLTDLERVYSLQLDESIKRIQGISKTSSISFDRQQPVKYNYAGVVAVMGILLLVGPSYLLSLLSHDQTISVLVDKGFCGNRVGHFEALYSNNKIEVDFSINTSETKVYYSNNKKGSPEDLCGHPGTGIISSLTGKQADVTGTWEKRVGEFTGGPSFDAHKVIIPNPR